MTKVLLVINYSIITITTNNKFHPFIKITLIYNRNKQLKYVLHPPVPSLIISTEIIILFTELTAQLFSELN